MSMFKGLSDAFGGSKKKGFKSEGHALGGSRPVSRYDITFHGASLGMTLGKERDPTTNAYMTVVEKVATQSLVSEHLVK